jgi:hypothetical protein
MTEIVLDRLCVQLKDGGRPVGVCHERAAAASICDHRVVKPKACVSQHWR